ncbi:MAG: D-2-hydroxyacid dehydrogenase [Gammaproteobacteria bacterium]
MKAVFLDYATVDAADLSPATLQAAASTLTLHDHTPSERVVERLRGAEVALINKIRLGARELQALPELRYVGLAATGTDNVDLAAAREQGVAVTNIRDYCTPSVAQHVIAMMLTLARRLDRYRSLVRDGHWRAPKPFCLLDEPMRDLSDMTLGIVGYGALARGVEVLARALGMDILIANRPGGPPQPGRVDYTQVLETADVLTLHCPLTPATKHLIDAAALAAMRSSAILINTARGGLVDSAALADALRAGRLGGAGIDVLGVEPPPADEPLLQPDVPNLVLTPHVAWASVKARQRALDEVAANLAAFVQGQRRHRVEGAAPD